MVSQGLLFSEPSVAETGVWCALTDGINPAQWAQICRHIGTRRPRAYSYYSYGGFSYKKEISFRF